MICPSHCCVADRFSAGTPRRRRFVPCTNGWKVHNPLQPPQQADTRHLRRDGHNNSLQNKGDKTVLNFRLPHPLSKPF